MNFFDIFKLEPMVAEIGAAVGVLKKYMDDPRTRQAVSLIEDLEADPEVKAAIATVELVAKTLTATGTKNETTMGTTGGGAIG